MAFASDVEMSNSVEVASQIESSAVENALATNCISKTDLNKVIMNYLFTEGYQEAFELLKQETGIEPSPPIPVGSFEDRIKITDAIHHGRIEEALTLINSIYPLILTDNRDLCFQIQKQHLVELIREGRLEAALDFAQSRMAEEGLQNPEMLVELERVMALLAFTEPETSPFADVLLESQRFKLASLVNGAILTSEDKEPNSKLTSFYRLLLWAQNECHQKGVEYQKMIDFTNGSLEWAKY